MMKKVQITLEEDLLRRIDVYAREHYMSRSGLLSFAAAQLLNADEITKAVKEMSCCFRKIVDNNNQIDSETMQQINELETFCKLFSSQN